MSKGAVITADIVNSTLVPAEQMKKLREKLGQVLAGYKHEFFRGDSFQVYLRDPAEALTVVLKVRTEARKLSSLLDVRSAIGIGEANPALKKLSIATDEAFVLSGRAFDRLGKKNDKLAIESGDGHANHGLNVVASFADYIFNDVTEKQAEVLAELLKGFSQQEVTKKLKKSPSTINQHVQSAGWHAVARLLDDYKNLISTIRK